MSKGDSAAKGAGAALKGSYTNLPVLSSSRDSSLKNTRDIWGGGKLTNFRARARMTGIEATLSRDGSAARL